MRTPDTGKPILDGYEILGHQFSIGSAYKIHVSCFLDIAHFTSLAYTCDGVQPRSRIGVELQEIGITLIPEEDIRSFIDPIASSNILPFVVYPVNAGAPLKNAFILHANFGEIQYPDSLLCP